MQNSQNDNKSCKIYFFVDSTKVYFNADFDSGNVQKVQQISPYVFKVHPGFDKTKNTSTKTFFHFKVYGLKMCTATFIVTRVGILQKLINKIHSQRDENVAQYFPVFRRPNQQWKRITFDLKIYYNALDQPELSFSFSFDKDQYVQFAFSYPYSYEDCENFIESMKNKYIDHSSIYLHDEVLCYSQEKRKIHLLTITDKENCSKQRQQFIEDLFPQRSERSFKVSKPVILMSARVHPGQSPSSYAIQGALRFLLNEKDCRSYLLRKNFVIKIVPMLNPDGVYHGMFRADLNGENLNRVYTDCQLSKHPTIWSIKKYASWLNETKRVLFYFDFHAHPSTKNFFIYGNSFSDIVLQTQAQLFGKLIEQNCPYFQNFESIYSQKQMKTKHKNDSHSKQGCARVFMHKLFNIIHSYTVECGYFKWTKLNQIQDKQRDEVIYSGIYHQDREFQKIPAKAYEPECYMQMGKSILITVLDLFNLNPYPKRIKGQNYTHLELRKSCGTKIYQQIETFKMTDANSYRKLNELSSLIEEQYYKEKLKGTFLKISTNQGNGLLKEQLTYLNASPRSKDIMKLGKGKKVASLPKFKQSKRESGKQRSQKVMSESKLPSPPICQSPFPYRPECVYSEERTEQFVPMCKIATSKIKTLKFLYSDLQRFNENEINQEAIPQNIYPLSEKMISRQEIISGKNSAFFDRIKELPNIKVTSHNKSYNTALQPKQFVPETRESKIKSTLEKSLTLRKGSLSKVVLIKKDDLKYLRIANLIEKKIQRQAINGTSKKVLSKQMKQDSQKDNLPVIKGRKKN